MPSTKPDYGDLPREELMEAADELIAKFGGPDAAAVHFKFTCEKCGERCTFQEENSLYESGECHVCGHDTPITKGGFALMMKFNPPKKA